MEKPMQMNVARVILWNQGISRTQGTNPRLQNLLTTQPLAGNIASVFILGTTATGEVFKIIWT